MDVSHTHLIDNITPELRPQTHTLHTPSTSIASSWIDFWDKCNQKKLCRIFVCLPIKQRKFASETWNLRTFWTLKLSMEWLVCVSMRHP